MIDIIVGVTANVSPSVVFAKSLLLKTYRSTLALVAVLPSGTLGVAGPTVVGVVLEIKATLDVFPVLFHCARGLSCPALVLTFPLDAFFTSSTNVVALSTVLDVRFEVCANTLVSFSAFVLTLGTNSKFTLPFFALFACLTKNVLARVVVIHYAITVVVFAVAGLFDGKYLLLARGPLSSFTNLRPFFAQALVLKLLDVVLAEIFELVVVARATQQLRLALGVLEYDTRFRIAHVVDKSVTVVVFSVANFFVTRLA